MNDQNITGGAVVAIITALFGIIVYLIRKPQDMWGEATRGPGVKSRADRAGLPEIEAGDLERVQ